MEEASHSYPSFSKKKKKILHLMPLQSKSPPRKVFLCGDRWNASFCSRSFGFTFFCFIACQDKRGPFLRLGVQSLLPDCSTLSWFLHSCSKKDASYWRATSASCCVWTPAQPRGRLECRLVWRLEKKWKKMLLVVCISWYLLLSLSHNTKKGKKYEKK